VSRSGGAGGAAEGRAATADAFGSLKSQTGDYVSDRRYLKAWTYGSRDGTAKVCLLWTDGLGGSGVDRFDFEHYFYVRTEDAERGRGRSVLRKLTQEVRQGRRRSRVLRVERDERYPAWSRVYVEVPSSYFYTRCLISVGGVGYVNEARIDGRDRTIDMCSPSLVVAREAERRGLRTFEADLNPIRRFAADNEVQIVTSEGLSEMYFDIETDDRAPDLFRKLGKYRILSIGWVRKEGAGECLVLDEETDDAERDLIGRFLRELDGVDYLMAWNGSAFDFYYLYERCRRLGLRWKWHRQVQVDLLPVFKRYHFRAGVNFASYQLDKLAKVTLSPEAYGGGKVDLAGRLDEVDPGWRERDGSAIGSWSSWSRHRDLHVEYLMEDCRLLRELERATGYAHLEVTFSLIGNCFADDYHVGTKIDGLLVRKGYVEGVHWPTVDAANVEEQEQYEGAYVHEPVRGLHRDVCAFDFKSLYPSIMTTFNISPETYVPDEEVGNHDPADLIETPIGTRFRRPRLRGDGTWEGVGFVPQMFGQTLELRKTYTDLQGTVEVGGPEFLHYYRLAYSYKRLGLSFYGELGNVRGRYYSREVARSVTLSGQHFIKLTIAVAERLGYVPLYGDTDSIYVAMPPERGEAFVEECQREYFAALPAFNADPERCSIFLEYEDVYSLICLISKKRYFGRMTLHKGKAANHLEVKGLEVMRSDGVEEARALQRRIMASIALEEAGVDEVRAIVEEWRRKVYAGEVEPYALAEVKGLSKHVSEYVKAIPPHVRVARKIRDSGGEYYVGMKVELIWAVSTHLPRPERDPDLSFAENVAVLERWREDEAKKAARTVKPPKPEPIPLSEYHPEDRPYDARFYWSSKIYPPTFRILEIAFPSEDWRSLDDDRREEAERKIVRYRRALLDPKRRGKAVEDIGKDRKLSDADRSDLAGFYVRNVLASSG